MATAAIPYVTPRRGHSTRGAVDHGAEWYCSPAAEAALDTVFLSDHRRSWDPRNDSPSLATLRGAAKKYGSSYVESRRRMIEAAGVCVRTHTSRMTGAICWIVTMPDEPLSAAIRVDRRARTLGGV